MSTHLKNYFLQTRLADAVLDADPPAFDDVECCLACDSTAFYLDGKPIGTICVFRYDQQLGILLSLSKIARAHFLNLIFFSSNSENTYFERIF